MENVKTTQQSNLEKLHALSHELTQSHATHYEEPQVRYVTNQISQLINSECNKIEKCRSNELKVKKYDGLIKSVLSLLTSITG